MTKPTLIYCQHCLNCFEKNQESYREREGAIYYCWLRGNRRESGLDVSMSGEEQ